mgnify:FL=1
MNPNLAAGNYVVVVVADGANQQPESDENNNKASSGIAVTPPPFPDLVVSNILGPEVGVAGQVVDLVWTVANQGTAAATGPWSETISLSGDEVIGQDQLLSTLVFTNGLGVGESLVRTQRVSLPLTAAAGTGRFVVAVDTAQNVLEQVETNNAAMAEGVTQVPASLTLRTVAPAIAENAANPVLRATVSRNGAAGAALTVNVSNSDLTELEGPATVIIPAGQVSVGFDLRVKQDNVVDGNQDVRVAVSAEGYIADELTVTVVDTDVHRLGLVIGADNVLEGKTVPATVSRDQANGEELVVRLSSSNPAQLFVPDAVTIPANDLAVSFAILAVDDTLVEAATRYGVSASAAGYAGASASVVVNDDDWPQVRVEVPVAALSEGGADQVVMARVVRAVASSRPQVLELVSSDAEAVWLPTRVTIPPNETAASFTILAVDDDRVNGTRRVSVRVFVLDSGGTRLTEGTGASFDVTDNDGPTLRLALARSLVGEGLRPATVGTVRRDPVSGEPLVVSLLSSDVTEATLPASVTIAANEASATFNIETVDDGTPDGNQNVTVTASAAGFNPAVGTLVVTDRDLPDLLITELSVPAEGPTDGLFDVTYRLVNQGLSVASGSWVQKIYLSRDGAYSGEDKLLGQYAFTGEMGVGKYFEQKLPFYLPEEPGDYWVIVVADATGQIDETIEDNNTTISRAPIRAVPAYSATVETDVGVATAGTPVPMVGRATRPGGGAAAFELVNIQIKLRETARMLSVLTDTEGRFTATFQPLPGEAGHYQIGAVYPGVTQVPVQDEFTLLGMRANPGQIDRQLTALSAITGTVNIENLSEVPLTGLSATVAGATGVGVSVEVTNRLAGSGVERLSYRIESLLNERAVVTFLVRLSSSEGVVLEVPVRVGIAPLEAHLRVTPNNINAGMVRGEQSLVTLEVVNVGSLASGPLLVTLPELAWLHVNSTNPMPSLAPGETNVVALQLLPPPDLAIGEYKGSLAIVGQQVAVTIPFQIKNVSAALGDLKITTVDERTYYGGNPTNLAGANIVVRDPFSNEVVASGPSDEHGEFLVPGMREGTYNLEVTAVKHDRSTGTLEITPGQVTEKTVFLRTQLVSYKWTVEEIEIEDRTKITLETVYETFVPTPVVTVEPTVIDLATVTGNQGQIDLKITNHGLVAAKNVTLNLPTHPLWVFEPLISEVDSLPAKSSLTIPLVVRRTGLVAAASTDESGNVSALGADQGPCTASLGIVWTLICGPWNVAYPVPIPVINLRGNCSGFGGIGGGSGGGGWGGWGGWGGIGYSGGGSPPPQYRIDVWPTAPSFSPTNNCACDSATFTADCIKGEAGLKIEVMGAVTTALNAALATTPIKIEGFKWKFLAGGQLCTCCENGIKGLKAKAEAGVEFEAKAIVSAKSPTPKARSRFRAWAWPHTKPSSWRGRRSRFMATSKARSKPSATCASRRPA